MSTPGCSGVASAVEGCVIAGKWSFARRPHAFCRRRWCSAAVMALEGLIWDDEGTGGLCPGGAVWTTVWTCKSSPVLQQQHRYQHYHRIFAIPLSLFCGNWQIIRQQLTSSKEHPNCERVSDRVVVSDRIMNRGKLHFGFVGSWLWYPCIIGYGGPGCDGKEPDRIL